MSYRQFLVKTDEGYRWVDEPQPAPPVRHGATYTEAKPLKSRALSVHSSQADHFNEMAARHGISGVHYDSKGTCWFTSRYARNEVMKRRGTCDMDAGYGDYAGE